ncbi:MAG: chromosomal replication initiator protein DnaA [Clostridia bacterium]|nr:chromosomal replication initiator protein DnaA [Clostridia bacterium]
MQELTALWEKVLLKIENLVSMVSYDLWVAPIEPLEYKDNKTLVLVANSATAKGQLMRNLNKSLCDSVALVFGEHTEVEILDPQEKQEYIKKNQISTNKQLTDVEEQPKQLFNPRYTFDNFVVGKSNQYCYAAARAIAENPGTRFNPLFIYGGVGLGKTHLLHAIGNFLQENNQKLKIQYVTCNQFTNDYITSLGTNKENANVKGTAEFREKYRNVDVLMVDDIQFISNRISTQEEFFNTFNDLYQNNKQIIMSSDRPPKEIEALTDRLASRFASGLIQDIQKPDFETRIAILRKKATMERYLIDDEVIEFIAENLDSNIREMEGMLSKVYFLATLMGKKSAGLDEAREAFKEQLVVQKQKLTPEKIIECVCDYFGVTYAEVVGKKKSKEIVEPRMISIYLIYDMLGLPLKSIAGIFGKKDHTTIIYSRDKITEMSKSDKKTKLLLGELKKQINER